MPNALPRISIVTPSYNQGIFLEATIHSILDQNYPNLEYIIMDGGSTDGSVEIIKHYQDRLTYWQSEQDRGQNHAITEGFKHATGEIYAYLNSDDIYMPWTFATVAQVFSQLPQVEWLTTRTTMVIDAEGDPIMTNTALPLTSRRFYSGLTLGDFAGQSGWIQQEGTFWRRELWEKAGSYIDESLYMTGDFELWARFFQHATLTMISSPLAAYRLHGENKTRLDQYVALSRQVLAKYPQERKYAPWQFKLLNALVRRTGRGANRFGAVQQRVDYDFKTDRWNLKSFMTI